MQIRNFTIDQNLRELTPHRTVDLPIACYETTILKNIHGYIPLHWHEELQFMLILRGKATFQINGESLDLHEGEGLFINSGCLHMIEDREKTGCVYICLNVSPQFVLPQELFPTYVLPYIHATNLPYLRIIPTEDWGKNIIEGIVKIKEWVEDKPPFYEINISSKLTYIWQNLIINGVRLEFNESEMVKSLRMKDMLNWIHLHYKEKINLNDIAKAGQLSRSECCRYFNRVLKTTPLAYVIDYRIQKSLPLLKQPDSNVTEVAFQLGFNSTSYFIEKFKSVMNMTPLAYKRK